MKLKLVVVTLWALACSQAYAVPVKVDNKALPKFSMGLEEPVAEFIRWLPANTETLIVTQTPVTVDVKTKYPEPTPISFAHRMTSIGSLFPDYAWWDGVKFNRVVAGSCNFRRPKNLGVFPFDGCSILLVDKSSPVSSSQMLAFARVNCSSKTLVQGVELLCFQRQMEDDLLPFYFCSPQKDVVLWATDLGYLTAVLQRSKNGEPQAALLKPLLWKAIPRSATLFVLRDTTKAKGDSAEIANTIGDPAVDSLYSDRKPIGYAASYQLVRKELVVSYYSNDAKALQLRKYWETHSECIQLCPCILSTPSPNELRVRTIVDQGSREAKFCLPLTTLGGAGHNVYI